MSEMRKELTWESECKPHIKFFNPDGDIAICVLWNKLDTVIPSLKVTKRLAMVGNLRTPMGISWFFRGLLLYPNIKKVILWGMDYTHTGDALVALWRQGPDAIMQKRHGKELVGDPSQMWTEKEPLQLLVPKYKWQIDKAISAAHIQELSSNVCIMDVRKDQGMTAVNDLLSHISPSFSHHNRQPEILSPMQMEIQDTLSSSDSGITVRAKDVHDAWLQVVNIVMKYGRPRITRKQEVLRHFFSLGVTFPAEQEEDYLAMARKFGMVDEEFTTYFTNFISDQPPDHGVDYRYGHRMQNWRGHNQLSEIVARLGQSPDTKRASISLLDATDLEELEDAPCYISATYTIIDNTLHSSHVFRSHDIYNGWPLNALAISRLHSRIANMLNVKLGTITLSSHNAQIYQRCWQNANDVLDQWGDSFLYGQDYKFEQDICGNFIFSLHDDNIHVTMTAPDGNNVIWECEDKDPFKIVHTIAEVMPGIDRHHLVYLGSEARKIATHRQLPEFEYIQD